MQTEITDVFAAAAVLEEHSIINSFTKTLSMQTLK
jgi:hypothetical protein